MADEYFKKVLKGLNFLQRRAYLNWIDERINEIKERHKRELDSMLRLKEEVQNER